MSPNCAYQGRLVSPQNHYTTARLLYSLFLVRNDVYRTAVGCTIF